jgi:formamidopyrimidine-DNA glycosylase
LPELPEVETVRRDLASALVDARVARVTVTGARTVRRQSADAFAAGLKGARLSTFERWGKYLLIGLDSGRVLVAHLRMSGQLLLAPTGDAPVERHTHARVRFSDGRELRFVDPRTFGELFVTSPELPELAGLGTDALGIDLDAFAKLLATRRARLKPLLLDQRAVAGIGNIYSDEILWAAGLCWYRRADRLRPVEVRRLHSAMTTVLTDAIEHRGSSLGDGQYVDLSGRPGGYQALHNVYGRTVCPQCARPLQRTVVAQRSHYWCRTCQR